MKSFLNKSTDFIDSKKIKISDTAKDSIFVRPSQPDQLYKLKDGIKFHLFINTAPCGDARIFSPHETEIGVDKHPNRYVPRV